MAQVPEVNSLYTWICPKLGIADVGKTNHRIEGFRVKNEFMLTDADGEYRITDAFDSSNTVSLDSECKVYLESTDASELPLLWERDYGKGKTVTINFGIYEKPYRGIYAAGYSLLGSACAYPVINGSAFYIDDFPSPIPGGSNEYIEEDYGMDMKEFYSQIWWKDLSNLAEKYEFPYTGTVIEAYSEQVEAPFERNMDPWRYEYFGGLLIKQGGEIGLHGYNHMPLCLKNFQLPEGYEGYEKWSTTENMKLSLEELREFCQELFPDEKFQVYVPAANILSDEARKMIGKDFPEIRSIASMYLPEDILYDQEFEVAKDGIVECPRVTSGLIVNDYNRIAAFSELNMHYVNTHYQHPNEVMIEASGAAMGWEKQFENFSDYVEWVYEAAPDIRSLTGSELAGAVQRFYCVDVESKETKKGLTLTLEQFHEEAWVMVRFNDWEPDTESVKGGSLTKLGGNLYLLEAKQDKVTIEKRR